MTTATSIQPAKWARGNLLPLIFGISAGAARKYRERGVWLEGLQWKKDPVGRVIYNIPAITNWMETGV